MIEPRSSVLQLATGLVEAELAREVSAWHVTVRLHASLARMVGSNGFDVLLARALQLAKTNHPVLAPFVAGSGGKIEGPADPIDHAALERAAIAVVANFVELLVVLIGEDLTMRLLREVQRDAPASGTSSAKEPTK